MNAIEIEANIIDLNARIDSLEAMFEGYVRVNERRDVSCKILMDLNEMYLDILQQKFASLPAELSQGVQSVLFSQMENAQKKFDHYKEWMKLVDSVEEFEDTEVDRFERFLKK